VSPYAAVHKQVGETGAADERGGGAWGERGGAPPRPARRPGSEGNEVTPAQAQVRRPGGRFEQTRCSHPTDRVVLEARATGRRGSGIRRCRRTRGPEARPPTRTHGFAPVSPAVVCSLRHNRSGLAEIDVSVISSMSHLGSGDLGSDRGRDSEGGKAVDPKRNATNALIPTARNPRNSGPAFETSGLRPHRFPPHGREECPSGGGF